AQAGRLAAARGAHQDHELAVPDLEVEILHGAEVAEALPDVVERHGGHNTYSCPIAGDIAGPCISARPDRAVDGPRTCHRCRDARIVLRRIRRDQPRGRAREASDLTGAGAALRRVGGVRLLAERT